MIEHRSTTRGGLNEVMRHDLFTDSEDFVEQIWGREIDKRFSFYAVFWSEFVGKSKAGGRSDPGIRGYGLRFPAAMAKEKQEFIGNQYRKICQTHYALFCHLAGAHYEISRLRQSPPKSHKQSFVYFETLGNLYSRLGSAIEVLRQLWGWFYELRNESPYKPRSFAKSVKRQFERDLGAYHLTRSYKELLRQVVFYQKAFSYLQRFATLTQGNRVHVPRLCKKRYPFFDKESFKELVECKQKALEDLEALEIFANCLQAEYLKNLKSWLEHRSISIKDIKTARTGLLEPTESEGAPEAAQSSKPALVEPSTEEGRQEFSREKPVLDNVRK
jgi:hypothetical protein